jgi:predicted enzyme related to lactoylglutathione lyase
MRSGWSSRDEAYRGARGLEVITGVRKVVVPVDDQARAKEFWTEVIGFDLVRDETYGDERWIEVAPPDRSLLLVLSRRTAHERRPDAPDLLPHSNVFFDCDDIERTHAELSERGVHFTAPPAQMHFGWWSLFEDPEGTRFVLGQWESGAGAEWGGDAA